MRNISLVGIFSALLTPFDNDEQIDEASLRRLIRFNLQNGVDGLYVGGSSAEAFMLSDEERCRIMEIAVDEVAGKAKLIAHVGGIRTQDCETLANKASALGFDAVSAVAPFYYGFSFDEIIAHYRAIIAAAEQTPMVVYNFPAMSGVKLGLDQISALLDLPHVVGLKQTSGDLYQMEQIRTRHPDIVLYNGFDELFASGLIAGADGGIGSTYNLMSWRYRNIQKLLADNNIAQAKEIQSSCNRIIDKLLQAGVFAGLKEMLCHMGVIETPRCRRPFSAVQEPLRQELHTLANTLLDEVRR